jgi:signal transduction histidine kinase
MRLIRLFVLLVACVAAVPSLRVAGQDRQKKVLVVYSTRRDTLLPTIGDREIPKLLTSVLPTHPDYYSEHIDAARFPEEQYREAFREYLRLKYRGVRFDVVVVMHRLAFDLVTSVRDELFPGTPLVFLSQDPTIQRGANSTGVFAEVDYGRTVDLATALQPDTTQVFVVTGSSARDQAMERVARAQFAAAGRPLAFTFLTGLSTEELEQRLATLPAHAIVYYLILYQDARGTNVTPLDYLERLAAISNRPVYSWTDSTIGRGAVGGSLMSLDGQVGAAARLAGRVLRGESADTIPVTPLDLQVDEVDWRQLERWQIDESRVPVGTRVLFREPNMWERDRAYILGVAAVMLVETALIAGLIVQAARRRRAEARAHAAASDLRASYDRIRDLGARLIDAQEAERARIARDLHDDISQQLTLLRIDLDVIAGAHRAGGDALATLSHDVLERTTDLARSVHQLSHRLHPAGLRFIGLVAALSALQRETHAPDVQIVFSHERVPAHIPQDLMLCLYRIAQEALQNAIKYSGASEITIRLAGSPEGLTLSVADDGVGFDVAAARGGLGLISMRERLEPFGGMLHIRSEPGRGACIEAVVPAPTAAAVRPAPAEIA